jgi:hypothetical protein
MSKQPDLFGTDPHHLHRADSPHTSVTSAYAVNSAKLERLVFEAIHGFGKRGCIADDVLAQFPTRPYGSITPRFIALERKEFIVRGPDTRLSQHNRPQLVMRAKEFIA